MGFLDACGLPLFLLFDDLDGVDLLAGFASGQNDFGVVAVAYQAEHIEVLQRHSVALRLHLQ